MKIIKAFSLIKKNRFKMDSHTKFITSTESPIYVDIFSKEILPIKGNIGMTFAPGKKGTKSIFTGKMWDRDLDLDLEILKNVYKADFLVSLMEDFEYEMLNIPNIREKCLEKSIINIRFAVVDGSIPKPGEIEKFKEMVMHLKESAESGKNIIIHCMGGLGRTGTLASCILIVFGFSSEKAIEETRKCRKGTLENRIQEEFVFDFEKKMKLEKYI